MKTKYYIIWIEGFSYRRGEKVKCLTNTGYDITLKLTEAMRVKAEDIPAIKDYLKRHGVADWVIDSSDTFQPTTYAPSGTVLDLNREAI